MNKMQKLALVVLSSVAGTSAMAAIDTTAATAAVTDAQTALLVIIGAMTTFAIALWGAKKVAHFFGGGK